MALRIVPPPNDYRKKSSSGDGGSSDPPPENLRLAITAFILIVVPITAYTFGKENWGHEIGTHIGFANGVLCITIGSYIIYLSGWFYDIDWE